MQTIILNYDGQNLSLYNNIILDNDLVWKIQRVPGVPEDLAPLPPELFSISIFHLNPDCEKKIINVSVIGNAQLTTDLSSIQNKNIKVSILLYFNVFPTDYSPKIIQKDVDVIIRREGVNN